MKKILKLLFPRIYLEIEDDGVQRWAIELYMEQKEKRANNMRLFEDADGDVYEIKMRFKK